MEDEYGEHGRNPAHAGLASRQRARLMGSRRAIGPATDSRDVVGRQQPVPQASARDSVQCDPRWRTEYGADSAMYVNQSVLGCRFPLIPDL
jgi:hypothetical protein